MPGLPWSNVPTHLLRAELLRRQEQDRPTCGTKGGRGHYNTPAHVFALILILVLSTAGQCAYMNVTTNPMLIATSMLVPHYRKARPTIPRSPPLPLPLETLRHRCAYCDGLCPPAAHGFRIPYRSMPSSFLEQRLLSDARLGRYDKRLRSGRH